MRIQKKYKETIWRKPEESEWIFFLTPSERRKLFYLNDLSEWIRYINPVDSIQALHCWRLVLKQWLQQNAKMRNINKYYKDIKHKHCIIFLNYIFRALVRGFFSWALWKLWVNNTLLGTWQASQAWDFVLG